MMGYTGDNLAEFVDRSRKAVDPAMEMMADDGGIAMTRLVIENTPVDTSKLRQSMEQKPVVKVTAVTGVAWESGTHTEVDYGPHVEHGTGLWGPHHSKYRIEPKDPNGVLAFYARVTTPEGRPLLSERGDQNLVEGTLVFARYVMHPGSPGAHMFAIAAAEAENRFDEITSRGLREWVRLSEAA